MKTEKKTFGDRVRELREHYGKSQTEFATLIGLKSYQGVSKIENGTTEIAQDSTINKIVSAFGTTREWLLHGKGEMLPGGMVELQVEQTGISINPYRDYLVQKLEDDVKYYKNLISQMIGGGGFQVPVNDLAAA